MLEYNATKSSVHSTEKYVQVGNVSLPRRLLCPLSHFSQINVLTEKQISRMSQKQQSRVQTPAPLLSEAVYRHPGVLSRLYMCVCVSVCPPTLSPACGSGRQGVAGHNRGLPIGPLCSQLWRPTGPWQCPIITPPSPWQSCPVLSDTQVSRSPGAFPLPRHSPDQISEVGRGAAASPCRRRMPRPHLEGGESAQLVNNNSRAHVPACSFHLWARWLTTGKDHCVSLRQKSDMFPPETANINSNAFFKNKNKRPC